VVLLIRGSKVYSVQGSSLVTALHCVPMLD
jgi:hypothetical protein